jgi:hypothetical protein
MSGAPGTPVLPAPEPAERTSRQVWVLGAKILVIQVVTLIALWVIEAVYAGG